MKNVTVFIPGSISVSFDFWEDPIRDELEKTYGVSIETGPGGVVEIYGSSKCIEDFLSEFGIDIDEVEISY